MIIFELLVLAFFNLIFAIEVNGDEAGYCANPVMESENIVDIQFIHDHYKQGWNVQFGNKIARTLAARVMQGTDSPKETQNPDEICFRTSFDMIDIHHIIGTMSGHGLSAEWNCSDANHVYECTLYSSKNDYKSEAIFYLVYFDGNENHNAAAVAMCYPDDSIAWFAISISKVLSDGTKTILDRFTKLGFVTSDRVPLQSENCP